MRFLLNGILWVSVAVGSSGDTQLLFYFGTRHDEGLGSGGAVGHRSSVALDVWRSMP